MSAAFAASVSLASTPPARADDSSFLDDLHSHGVGTGILSVGQQIRMGNGACVELHQGKTPEQVAGEVPQLAWAGIDGLGVALAAQRDLCPDTIR